MGLHIKGRDVGQEVFLVQNTIITEAVIANLVFKSLKRKKTQVVI